MANTRSLFQSSLSLCASVLAGDTSSEPGLAEEHQHSAGLLAPEERQEGSDVSLSLRAQSPSAAALSWVTLDAAETKPMYDYGKTPTFLSAKHPAMPLKPSLGMHSISKADSGLEYTFFKIPTQ